jgi:brefeldin A-resistance guanine nucleotide exchange factor 1
MLQAEAIPESLKNVVLVMNANGLLVPPERTETRSESQQELWQVTHARIEQFLPGFMEELFPPPPPEPALQAVEGAPVEQPTEPNA